MAIHVHVKSRGFPQVELRTVQFSLLSPRSPLQRHNVPLPGSGRKQEGCTGQLAIWLRVVLLNP
jgi:hypothetical protein